MRSVQGNGMVASRCVVFRKTATEWQWDVERRVHRIDSDPTQTNRDEPVRLQLPHTIPFVLQTNQISTVWVTMNPFIHRYWKIKRTNQCTNPKQRVDSFMVWCASSCGWRPIRIHRKSSPIGPSKSLPLSINLFLHNLRTPPNRIYE